tara:strand:+ start:182 stop:1210 length:1029 start_codon:yes stop_codon:yes gene_type:complete
MNQVTALRYFMPLVIEGNRRGLQSRFFIEPKPPKYNCCFRNIDVIKKLSKEFNIQVFRLNDIQNYPNSPTFFIEDQLIYNVANIKNKKYIIPSMIDYIAYHSKKTSDPGHAPGRYVDHCDNVFMVSEFLASYYDCVSEKNVYLGSPKYDVALKSQEIFAKYNISPLDKYALVVFPRIRDHRKIDLVSIYDELHSLGYKIIVKNRGKDHISDKKLAGDLYLEDVDWFPHTTMELIKISDFIINFSSTTIKESIMLRKPIINFDIKPFKTTPMKYLYEYNFCKNMDSNFSTQQLRESIVDIQTNDFTKDFDNCIKNHLFENKNVSKNIVDFVMKRQSTKNKNEE